MNQSEKKKKDATQIARQFGYTYIYHYFTLKIFIGHIFSVTTQNVTCAIYEEYILHTEG